MHVLLNFFKQQMLNHPSKIGDFSSQIVERRNFLTLAWGTRTTTDNFILVPKSHKYHMECSLLQHMCISLFKQVNERNCYEVIRSLELAEANLGKAEGSRQTIEANLAQMNQPRILMASHDQDKFLHKLYLFLLSEVFKSL